MSAEPLTVRRGAAEDAERLTDMVHASGAYQRVYASIITGYQVTPDDVARHEVFLAEDGEGRLLGFYSLWPDIAELDLMFVADDAQGRGIGRLLIEHMLGQARQAGLSGVRVVSHPTAEGFYRSVGAERTGTVPAKPPQITWERPELWIRTG